MEDKELEVPRTMDENQQTPKLENERNIIVLCILGSIILSFIPSLVAFLLVEKTKWSDLGYKSIINLLNFEIYFFIIFFAIKAIVWLLPSVFGIFGLLGFFIFPVLLIINLIICIKAFQAFDAGSEYTYPINMPIIK